MKCNLYWGWFYVYVIDLPDCIRIAIHKTDTIPHVSLLNDLSSFISWWNSIWYHLASCLSWWWTDTHYIPFLPTSEHHDGFWMFITIHPLPTHDPPSCGPRPGAHSLRWRTGLAISQGHRKFLKGSNAGLYKYVLWVDLSVYNVV